METIENKEQVAEEVSNETLRKMAEMKHKSLSTLLGIYIDTFSATMLNGNKTSYQKKVEAAKALKEAILFAVDFGLDLNNPKIRDKGMFMSKEVNGLAGVMVQTLDNRMLLLAEKMSKLEENKTKVVDNTTQETKGNE